VPWKATPPVGQPGCDLQRRFPADVLETYLRRQESHVLCFQVSFGPCPSAASCSSLSSKRYAASTPPQALRPGRPYALTLIRIVNFHSNGLYSRRERLLRSSSRGIIRADVVKPLPCTPAMQAG
jgi:hypothetical protein